MPALTDFRDLYETVLEQLKIPVGDATTLARVKRDINIIYCHEVVPFKRWPWLVKRFDVTHEKFYNSGSSDTASVTQGSTTITLSAIVPVAKGSLRGFFYKSQQFSEVYTIDSHTAGTDTLELTVQYNGETTSDAGFRIWRDNISLPTDARETIGLRHDLRSRDVIPRGAQKLDELAQQDRAREDWPKYYSTDIYVDPTPGDPETEADRFRKVRIWPALFKDDITIHVDYIKEVSELVSDGDEPFLPVEDRIVLVYGALRQAWLRERNPEAATNNEQLFQAKLNRMAAKIEDALDAPRLEVDDNYIGAKRTSIIRRDVF